MATLDAISGNDWRFTSALSDDSTNYQPLLDDTLGRG
jgi:hypothetical protein